MRDLGMAYSHLFVEGSHLRVPSNLIFAPDKLNLNSSAKIAKSKRFLFRARGTDTTN
jgi:hypothetical protein